MHWHQNLKYQRQSTINFALPWGKRNICRYYQGRPSAISSPLFQQQSYIVNIGMQKVGFPYLFTPQLFLWVMYILHNCTMYIKEFDRMKLQNCGNKSTQMPKMSYLKKDMKCQVIQFYEFDIDVFILYSVTILCVRFIHWCGGCGVMCEVCVFLRCVQLHQKYVFLIEYQSDIPKVSNKSGKTFYNKGWFIYLSRGGLCPSITRSVTKYTKV